MKQLQPVIWSKGTFLTPQHLQAQDRFSEDSLNFRIRALSYHAYGFQSLSIDHEKLSEGRFTLAAASGIMPDGLLFDIPRSDRGPESKQFADHLDAEQNSIDIFLAVPDQRQYGLNVSLDASAATRYVARTALFRDENTGTNEKPVQLAGKNFRLLVEGEPREGTSALRIARVQRTGAGTFRLDPSLVPPVLSIGANECLISVLRSLVEQLAGRSTALSSLRRQKNQTLADFTASDIANFWLLYTVNSHLPVLHHFFNMQKVHPQALYAEMVALAGTLTTFSTTVRPGDFPEYDHDDLGACFGKLNATILELLAAVVPSNFVSLPLRLVQPSLYATAIDDDKYFASTRLYLAVSSDINKGELIRRVPQLVKVCSADHIDRLVKQALPGMRLMHMPSPPSAIPVKLNYEYFGLETSGAAWEAVCRARNLAAYVPNDIRNPVLELIILLPASN
ncbi:MAG: type VI secretion system baseplate subunit TssK [Terriglobales bacterium]